MPALRKVVHVLREMHGSFATSKLIVVGSDVALVGSCDEVMMLLQSPKQLAFPAFICDGPKTVRTIETGIRRLQAVA